MEPQPAGSRYVPPSHSATGLGTGDGQPMRILTCVRENLTSAQIRNLLMRESLDVHAVAPWCALEEELSIYEPHVLILDSQELLLRIRAQEKYETLVVMMLLAGKTDQDVFEAYHAGADMVF